MQELRPRYRNPSSCGRVLFAPGLYSCFGICWKEMKMQKPVRADPSRLRAFASQAFQRVGVPVGDADRTAAIMVEADLRGIDSHGVGHLHGLYIQGIEQGRINPAPDVRVSRGSHTTASVDGDGGLGFVVGYRAMSEAISMAGEHGSGWVTVGNSNHYGAGAYYAMMALDHDMVGFSFTSAGPLVAPPGGIEPLVGGNVIAVAAPGKQYGPFVLDMATCVVARGKIEIAARQGIGVPEGWATDTNGQPLTDPEKFFSEGGAILPLGSAVSHGAYKGFGLALVVEVLAGLLSGVGSFVPMTAGACHAFGALWLDGFPTATGFKGLMDAMIENIHSAPVIEGAAPVMYPGERENLTREERSKEGIPLHPRIVEDLQAMGEELGIPLEI